MTEPVIAITRCVSWALMPQKCVSGWGSAPDPAGGAYSAPPDPLAGFEPFEGAGRFACLCLQKCWFALIYFSSLYISFVWSLKVLEFDFTNGQEP